MVLLLVVPTLLVLWLFGGGLAPISRSMPTPMPAGSRLVPLFIFLRTVLLVFDHLFFLQFLESLLHQLLHSFLQPFVLGGVREGKQRWLSRRRRCRGCRRRPQGIRSQCLEAAWHVSYSRAPWEPQTPSARRCVQVLSVLLAVLGRWPAVTPSIEVPIFVFCISCAIRHPLVAPFALHAGLVVPEFPSEPFLLQSRELGWLWCGKCRWIFSRMAWVEGCSGFLDTFLEFVELLHAACVLLGVGARQV
mmetsp:Transcript_43882/g.93925  ORF Transcript_43882/g.93925 Transcript_43882/m.93925 type:complete len:247 (-) Transcript_43882:450-1190(-)